MYSGVLVAKLWPFLARSDGLWPLVTLAWHSKISDDDSHVSETSSLITGHICSRTYFCLLYIFMYVLPVQTWHRVRDGRRSRWPMRSSPASTLSTSTSASMACTSQFSLSYSNFWMHPVGAHCAILATWLVYASLLPYYLFSSLFYL